MEWHATEIQQVLSDLEVNSAQGLSTNEVLRRQQTYGKNALPEPKSTTLVKVFFHQFKSPLIYLLFMAALAAFIMGETSDALVILFVVTLNSIIGTFQEVGIIWSLLELSLSILLWNQLKEMKCSGLPYHGMNHW